MNIKKTARIVGILYIIGTIAGTMSVRFLSAGNAQDYLVEIAKNPHSLLIGSLLELVMGFALAMIPAFMFPVLKKYNEVLSLGYIIFRGALETFTYIVKVICFLSLMSLSVEYVATGLQNVSYFQTLGMMLKEIIDIPLTAFVFGAGALMFYTVLYKSMIIPRWISGFGLVAIILHITSGVLVLLGLQENFDTVSLIMNLPIALQEMIMAVWFIVKGFRVVETKPCFE